MMKKIFLLAAASLALAACDNYEDNYYEDNGPDCSEAVAITATIGQSTPSRAYDDVWSARDSIGISSTVGGKPGPFINYKYITANADGKFTGDSTIFYYKPMILTAYYPFTGSEGTAPGNGGKIAANTGAENQTATKQPKIDFLWDSKTGVNKKDFSVSNPEVNFTFAHKMSKLTFTFLSSEPVYKDDDPSVMISDGVDVGTMVSYDIEGLVLDGTFDTATGICAIDETKSPEHLKITFDKEAEKKDERTFASLIVFPQNNEGGYILHIETDELSEQGSPTQFYKCALTFNGTEIKPGYHYQFTIQVTKRGLIVGKLTIEPWTETEKFITATIDGGEKEFQEN